MILKSKTSDDFVREKNKFANLYDNQCTKESITEIRLKTSVSVAISHHNVQGNFSLF